MIQVLLSILLAISARAIELPKGLSLCDRTLTYTGAYDLKDPAAQVHGLLSLVPLHSSLLIEFFAGHPLLEPLQVSDLFDGSVAVSEGYTLREHTRMVLDLLRQQKQFYDIPSKYHVPLIFSVVFHDVGKPAVQNAFCEKHGRPPETREEFKACSRRQYEFTGPLFANIGLALHLPIEVYVVASNLNDGDYIGQVVTGKLSPEDGVMKIREVALANGWDPAEYFAIKTLLYVSDAGSYPGLRYGRGLSQKPPVFVEESSGRLVPVSPHFARLEALMK